MNWQKLSNQPEPSLNDLDLLENDLLNLTLPSRYFLLLSVRKVYDQMICLLRGVLEINRARSILKNDDQ